MAFQKDTFQPNSDQEGGDRKATGRSLQPTAIEDGGVLKPGTSGFEGLQPFEGGALNQYAVQPTAFQDGGQAKTAASGFEAFQPLEGADAKSSASAFQAAQNNALEQGGYLQTLIIDITGQGIVSAEAVGTAAVQSEIDAAGIVSSETVGSPTIMVVVTGGGGPPLYPSPAYIAFMEKERFKVLRKQREEREIEELMEMLDAMD